MFGSCRMRLALRQIAQGAVRIALPVLKVVDYLIANGGAQWLIALWAPEGILGMLTTAHKRLGRSRGNQLAVEPAELW